MTTSEIAALQISDIIVYTKGLNYKTSYIVEQRDLKFVDLRCIKVVGRYKSHIIGQKSIDYPIYYLINDYCVF